MRVLTPGLRFDVGRRRALKSLAALTLIGVARKSRASPTVGGNNIPLILPSDLIYKGSFTVPQGYFNDNIGQSFAEGGIGIGFNPPNGRNGPNGSLFMSGHSVSGLCSEISIPKLMDARTSGVTGLNTATYVPQATSGATGFFDPTNGTLSNVNTADSNQKFLGGYLVHSGKLIVTGFDTFDMNGTSNASHWSRPLDLSSTIGMVGPVAVGTPTRTAQYMCDVPAAWQSALGGPCITGMGMPGGAQEFGAPSGWQSHSNGPVIAIFNPANITGGPVTATELVAYGAAGANALGGVNVSVTPNNQYLSNADASPGCVFPVGWASVLVFGMHGFGVYEYGVGTSNPAEDGQLIPGGGGYRYDYDPVLPQGDHGEHAYSTGHGAAAGPNGEGYAPYVWAYSAYDLLAVKNGQKAAYEVMPYAVWVLDLPYYIYGGSSCAIIGAAYDATNNIIYLSHGYPAKGGLDVYPVVHAYTVGVAPNPPSNVSVS